MSRQGSSDGVWVAPNIYRRDSIRSSVSIASEVEMAHDEVFSGPMSESVPSSIASFAHRRSRHDSTVTFTYLTEDEDLQQEAEEAVEQDSDFEDDNLFDGRDDIESIASFSKRNRRSGSQASVEHPLLDRHESAQSFQDRKKAGTRISQKIYIVTEDLTAVITGFCTSPVGLAFYIFLCTISLGLGYLVLRWIPKWRLRLIGTPAPLKDCRWVAIEDQYGQFMIRQVSKESYGNPLSTVFEVAPLGIMRSDSDEDNDPILVHLRALEYRYLRFVYNPVDDTFQSVSGWKDSSWSSTKLMRLGLDADERDKRELVFGQNLIDVQQKSTFQLLVDEVLHPFYIFQIASLTLWSMDQYYYYAVCIFLISVFSITATIFETRSTLARLKEVSHFECNVRVLRNGFWRSVSSVNLVPGDVFEVSDPSLNQVPCDCLLLSGDCIINESMLTGESVPVSKMPVTEDVLDDLDLKAPSIHPTVAKNFLFYGTKIIRARRPRHSDGEVEAVALGIALRTGFSTTKGSLVRSMLFPKPSGFKFYRDSFRYISVMGMVALLGFTASFVNFIRLGLPWHTVVIRALDLITIVVPPALPATLTIGTNFALARLKRQQIFCISPQRVNVGGKLDVVCFDKTGTLTEDGLDVLGIRAVSKGKGFSDMFTDPKEMVLAARSEDNQEMDYDKCRDIVCTMATCHSLRVVDGELLGDPLDIKMFEFTGWTFEEGGNTQVEQEENANGDTIIPSVARPPTGSFDFQKNKVPLELGVLRSFEFVSQLRRTSVVVRQFGENGASVFVKGAPECMKEICHADTLPHDFDDLLSHYTHRGYRVIACAAKYEAKLSWMKIQKMSREQAESGLTFLGFIVFENKLKDTTTPVITELREAGIRTVMCTGDNILTAISVARECGLIDPNSPCFVPHLDSTQHLDPNASLTWESVDNPAAKLDEKTLLPVFDPAIHDVSIPLHKLNMDTYSLAVSGDIFRWLIDYASEDVLKRVLARGQVFARMSPDEKHELVERLQSLDYCCGFCGDGANDCGALKAADVGISLSDAEASVAAPFTSRIFDISCVPTLIKEGRAALVTSFCCFKYMSLYSAIQFTSVSFLYTSASNLGDFQYLYIDLALILPIAIFMGWNDPFPVLSRKRPTADLVSRKVLTPLIGQIVLAVLTQLLVLEIVRTRPWYIPPKVDLDDTNIENSENTALFLVSCYQYILSSVVLSVGPPFRQQIYKNAPFLITLGLTLALSTYMLSESSDVLNRVMQLTSMTWEFGVFIVILAICSFAVSWVAENHIFPSLARILGRLQPKREENRRQYKVLLEKMRS